MTATRITLRSLATEAGVSPMTVSHALRGSGRVSAEVREAVRALAKARGYQVDPVLAAGMAQMRRRPGRRIESVLAWLNVTPDRDPFAGNPVFQLMWKGAKAQAEEAGYRLERFWLNEPGVSPERLAGIFRARGIEGVVVNQYYRQAAEGGRAPGLAFDLSRFACASVGTRLRAPDIHFAQADHFACALLALRRLHANGFRRVGLVCPPSVDAITGHRVCYAYEGFVKHTREMKAVPVFRTEGTLARGDGGEALERWIARCRPEVILGWLLPWNLTRLGFSVPQEVGVVTIDRVPAPGYENCAGVDQNHVEIGAAGVRVVIEQLRQGKRGIPETAAATMIEGRWVEGESLPAR
ncbi:LacI family transcriptional regulator [Opitutaceae bacterium TAV5]|nr:LacI family transcriptional regulator [Opitutaceae bacterium TAV5]